MKNTNNSSKQLHNFMLFSTNYPPLFIEHCWKGQGMTMAHLRGKFHSSKSFSDFWFMLDGYNRDVLADYIYKNVQNTSKSFFIEGFWDEYETSTKLNWDDVKHCLGSKFQRDFYKNLCITRHLTLTK